MIKINALVKPGNSYRRAIYHHKLLPSCQRAVSVILVVEDPHFIVCRDRMASFVVRVGLVRL